MIDSLYSRLCKLYISIKKKKKSHTTHQYTLQYSIESVQSCTFCSNKNKAKFEFTQLLCIFFFFLLSKKILCLHWICIANFCSSFITFAKYYFTKKKALNFKFSHNDR